MTCSKAGLFPGTDPEHRSRQTPEGNRSAKPQGRIGGELHSVCAHAPLFPDSVRALSLTDADAAAPKFFVENNELSNLRSTPVKGKSSQIRFACVARRNAGYGEQDHKNFKYQEMLKSILKEIIVKDLKE